MRSLYGLWNPADSHKHKHERTRRDGWAEAKRRAKAATEQEQAVDKQAACGRLVVPTSVGPRTQRPYVTGRGNGVLRRFSKEPVALPPHPCMLCDAAFATKADLEHHVVARHAGVQEYRKRLFFLQSSFESIGPVPPALWRHSVEAFAEHFVTGSSDWPSCASSWESPSGPKTPWDWGAAPGGRVPSEVEFKSMVEKLVKRVCPAPWHSAVVSEVDLVREGEQLVDELFAADELFVPKQVQPQSDKESAAQEDVEPLAANPPHGAKRDFFERVRIRMLSEGALLSGDSISVSHEMLTATWSWALLMFLRGSSASTSIAIAEDFLSKEFPSSVGAEPQDANKWVQRLLNYLASAGSVERNNANGECWRLKPWWKSGAKEMQVHECPVNLEALQGDAAANDGRGDQRRVVRENAACAFCARSGWGRTYEYIWAQKQGSGPVSMILGEETRRGCGAVSDSGRSPRDKIAAMLDPVLYWSDWQFINQHGTGKGGIPWQEIEASSVLEPGTGRLWLLHKKLFRYVMDDDLGRMAADPTQAVPVCSECKHCLQGKRPSLPRFALSNDLWMGRLPPVLKKLSPGAWLLMALGRPAIKQMNCYTDGGKKYQHDPSQLIKAFVGNVCAFAQTDGSPLFKLLPPRAEDLVQRLLIAFVGSDQDAARAYFVELGVNVQDFEDAYKYLRHVNAVYHRVKWDPTAAKELEPDARCFGLPKVFSQVPQDPVGACCTGADFAEGSCRWTRCERQACGS